MAIHVNADGPHISVSGTAPEITVRVTTGAGGGGTVASDAPVVTAAAILLTPSLTPQIGDEIWTVIYQPGVDPNDWSGAVPTNSDFVKVTEYTYSGIWEADPNDFVLLMIDEGDGGQQDYWPSVYAKFTGTGFDPIAVDGGTLVSLSCGGAGFGVPAIFVGSNDDSPVFGGTWPLGPSEFFQPLSMAAQNIVTRYNFTGKLEGAYNAHQAFDLIDAFDFAGTSGGGTASSFVVDWIGAFGPGYDAMSVAGTGPFADPALSWGPDYVLIQSPWGTYATYQVSEGQSVACADYLDSNGDSVPGNERLFTLTDGEFLLDDLQPSAGDTVVLADWTVIPDAQWALGIQMVMTGDGRLELALLQHERAAVAQMAAVRVVTTDGDDSSEGGAPWGTVLVDASESIVERTLPSDATPGRTMTYVKVDSSSNTVLIYPNFLGSILGPVSPYILHREGESVRFVYDGTAWLPLDGPWGSHTTAQGEPHGFPNRTDSTIAFDDESLTFTISPVGVSFTVWCAGIEYEINSSESVTLPDDTGIYYIYFEDGALDYSTTFFDWPVQAPTAYVYWNSNTAKAEFFADERHGITLDWATHEYLHRTRGAAFANGFDLSGYTITGSGASNADAQIALSGGTFFDEDLEVAVVDADTPNDPFEQVLNPVAYLPVFYRDLDGWIAASALAWPLGTDGGNVYRNTESGGSWTQVEVSNGKYLSMWVVATNNVNAPVLAIMGQAQRNNVDNASTDRFYDLDLSGLPIFELRPLYNLVFQCGAYGNDPGARLRAVVDIRHEQSTGLLVGLTDHGALSGLLDDDHPQYQRADAVATTDDPFTVVDESLVITVGETVNLPPVVSMLGRNIRIAASGPDVTVVADGTDIFIATNSGTDTIPAGGAVEYTALDLTDFGIGMAWASNTAVGLHVDTAAFDGNLSAADSNVQAALNTIDDLDLVYGDDSRLTDDRAPLAHAATHGVSGADAITVAQSQVTDLTTDLSGKVPTTRTITAGTGLSGGGALSGNVTLSANLSASDIPNLDAGKITTGTIATARLGTKAVGGQDEGSSVTEPTVATSLLDSAITLPACAAGDVLMIRGGATLLQQSGTNKNITFGLKLGSTTILSWVFTSLSSSASTRVVTLSATVRVEGTSDVNATGYLTHNISGGTGNTATANGVATENIGSGSLTLDLTGLTSASGATQTFALQSISITKVSA